MIKNRWKVGTLSLVGTLAIGTGTYFYQQNAKYYDEVKAGFIRGNRKSRVYHLPHCPNYNSIANHHIIEFGRIEEAEARKFRPAQNCPNNIVQIRREFENR